jgi:hypothetical protein
MTFVKPVQSIKRWEQKCHQSKIQMQTSGWGSFFLFFFLAKFCNLVTKKGDCDGSKAYLENFFWLTALTL